MMKLLDRRVFVPILLAATIVPYILHSLRQYYYSTEANLSQILMAEEEEKGDEGDGPDERPLIIHVMNIYAISKDQTELDSTQALTMESAIRSISLSKDYVKVDLVCAVLEADSELLKDLPCRQVLLTRSTATEYPDIVPKKELPFLADILSASIESIEDGTEYYWMYTNSDIGLSQYFYKHLVNDLLPGREAVSVNRRQIPTKHVRVGGTETESGTSKQLAQIDSLIRMQGGIHPGYDCFVIKSTLLPKIKFGEFFLGHPPWGMNYHMMLQIMADNYVNFKTHGGGTFHLGNDKSKWNHHRAFRADSTLFHQAELCPNKFRTTDMLGLQNQANCGLWFEPRQYGNYTVPNFVQDGYEDLFLEKNAQSSQTA